ncbi:MAG: hypothetical protein QM730_25280 [Anaerolineales bacterium]
MAKSKEPNRYSRLIESIFSKYYRAGVREITFAREELEQAAKELKVILPKNLGDVLYTFRYRSILPESITSTAPAGFEWMICPAGRSKYKLALVQQSIVVPSNMMAETKIPDATPGIISRYALNDEQAALAKIRYNRLIDIFTGLTCYSLQNHLRTAVPEMGQVETDEIYIGIDKRGVHYVLPIQAKGRKDKIGIVQIEQDVQVCESKFPDLVCRPIAAHSLNDEVIALFEFEYSENEIRIFSEKHYKLVKSKDLSLDELRSYQERF